jgi:hypothetical protein
MRKSLVDYDFSKLHSLLSVGRYSLVTGKVEVMIRYTKEEFLKTERCHATFTRIEHDAVPGGC